MILNNLVLKHLDELRRRDPCQRLGAKVRQQVLGDALVDIVPVLDLGFLELKPAFVNAAEGEGVRLRSLALIDVALQKRPGVLDGKFRPRAQLLDDALALVECWELHF